jgi:hypothetical protein
MPLMDSTALGTIRARLISRFMRSTMAAGVPAGAQKPCDVPASKFLSPSSLSVGASGNIDKRWGDVTANKRSRPERTCEKAMPGSIK